MFPFDNTTGMDIIDARDNQNFLFVDQVPAASKPRTDGGGDNGVKVQAISGARLRVEAAAADRTIQILSSTSTNTPIQVTDTSSNTNFTRLGSGISNLMIQTNNAGNADVFVTTLTSGIHLRVDTGLGTNNDITLGQGNSITEQVIVKTGAGNCLVNVQEANGDDGTNAIVDFGSGGLGLGNVLNVFSVGQATLAPVDGTHAVFVDQVNVSGGSAQAVGSVVVGDDATIGDLNVFAHGDVRIAASSTINTFDVALNGTASVEAQATIGTLTHDGTVTFTTASTVTKFEVTQAAVEDATGVVNVNSSADVIALTTSRIGALNIPGSGRFTLQPRPAGGGARVLSIKSLFMGSDPSAPSGVLDIKDNAMIVDFKVNSPLDNTIKPLITSGYASTAWTGNGITSSTAAAIAANP